MKKCFIFIISFFIILISSYALVVEINVAGKIKGIVSYFNFSQTKYGIQNVILEWENIGSASCKAIARVDIYNFTNSSLKFLKSFWSEEILINPGDHYPFKVSWYNNPGNYLAKVYINYCFREEKVRIFNYSVKEKPIEKLNITITGNGDEKEIRIKIETNKTLKNIYIIPKEYPTGWIVPSISLEKIEPKSKEIRIFYLPQSWRETSISFLVFAENGKLVKEVKIKLKKSFDWNKILIGILIFSIGLNIYLLKNIFISRGKYLKIKRRV